MLIDTCICVYAKDTCLCRNVSEYIYIVFLNNVHMLMLMLTHTMCVFIHLSIMNVYVCVYTHVHVSS